MVLLVMSHSQMWSYRREAKIKSKTKLYTGNQFKSVAMQVTHWATRPFPTVRRHCLYLDTLCWTRFWNTFDRDKKSPTLFGITKSPAFLKFDQPHTLQLPGCSWNIWRIEQSFLFLSKTHSLFNSISIRRKNPTASEFLKGTYCEQFWASVLLFLYVHTAGNTCKSTHPGCLASPLPLTWESRMSAFFYFVFISFKIYWSP